MMGVSVKLSRANTQQAQTEGGTHADIYFLLLAVLPVNALNTNK